MTDRSIHRSNSNKEMRIGMSRLNPLSLPSCKPSSLSNCSFTPLFVHYTERNRRVDLSDRCIAICTFLHRYREVHASEIETNLCSPTILSDSTAVTQQHHPNGLDTMIPRTHTHERKQKL